MILKMSKYIILLIGFIMIGCSNFLDKQPSTIISSEQVFSNTRTIKSNIANLYSRMHRYYGFGRFSYKSAHLADFNDVFPSKNSELHRVRNKDYPYMKWNYWDYDYLHDINLFINRIKQANEIPKATRQRFLGEVQFLRAIFYFNEVKSMGGVPLVLDTLKYNFSGDASYLYRKRAPEAKVYDFVINEADSAAKKLTKNTSIKDHATWSVAMALKSRAALFAGSIAQHGVTTPSVSLPNHIVGIPANKAEYYYKIALSAAQKIIDSGKYHLYMRYPDSLAKNFAKLFLDKNNNPEVIFAQNYLKGNKVHQYTVANQPRSLSTQATRAGLLNPTLNFVQSFELLNGRFAPLDIKNPDGTYKRYDHVRDIFKNRDARLAGTVILPDSKFRGKKVDIWAGYYLPKKPKGHRIITGSQFGQQKKLPGMSEPIQIVGADGPIDNKQYGTQTGFYIRKYLDPTPGAGKLSPASDVWWIDYRYAGILLNAAEAAFQLEKNTLAAKYLNKIRVRAGLPKLAPNEMTFKRIVHAWGAEFAFEGKRLWNMKRWRLAHKIWDGGQTDLNHPANPWAASTQPWGLWPYKVYDPGQPDNGKWIFKHVLPSEVNAADRFRLGNYYSQISAGVLSNNPKLVPNPNH